MRYHARPATGEKTRGTWCKGNGDIRAGGISCTKTAPTTGEETLGTWCKGNGGIRASGISCTKSAPATGEETRGTWCKGNGGTRVGGISCTKSAPGHGRKNAVDLVQRKRKNKGRRDFVHQVAPTPRPPPPPLGPSPPRATPAHAEVYKLPYDNKSVLKGNFFCGIILSPERNQRCNAGNNMKGDAI